VVSAALDGNFDIVLSSKLDSCHDVGGCCASHNDAWVSIQATVPNLA
jgi:hypothetical protein